MFIVIIGVLLGFLLVGPWGIREQLHALGVEMDDALENDLPWAVKRLKSMIVPRLIMPSVAMALAEVTWVWALYKELPDLLDRTRLAGWTNLVLDRVDDADLKDAVQTVLAVLTLKVTDVWLRIALAAVFFLVVFAVWNYLQGHLRRTGTGENDWDLPYGLHTSLSLPHWWAVLVPSVWLVQGVYVTIWGIWLENRIIFVLGLLSLAIFWAMGKIGIEVLAALVLKGTGLGEWALSTVPKLPGVPQAIKDSIPKGGVNVLEQEKIAAGLRKYWNLLAIMWLPFISVVFWFCQPDVAIAMGATTGLASFASLMMVSLGEGGKVDKATKSTTEWIWKWGKLITPLLFGFGALLQLNETVRMWWDDYGNAIAGITPIVTFNLKPGYYIVIALGIGLVMWLVKKVFDKASGTWEKAGKVVKAGLGLGAIYCVVAVIALICHHPTFSLARRYSGKAEAPVGLTTPTAVYRDQNNGQQELVIQVFSTEARNAKGVVEFDKDTAAALGVPEQVPFRSYSGMETCGGKPCRRYEVRIPDVASVEGHYKVVMRNAAYGAVEESTRRAL